MNNQNFIKFLLLSLILVAGISLLANSGEPAFASELDMVVPAKWIVDLDAQSKECPRPPGAPSTKNCHWGSPVLAHIDGDNFLDIVAVTNKGYVVAVRHNGQLLWQKDLGPAFGMAPGTQEIASSPAVADIDGDGLPEIVVGAGSNFPNPCTRGGVIVLDHNGNVQPGWPKFGFDANSNGCEDSFFSTPALADLNDDGKLEVIIGGFDKRIYAWDYQGTLMPGFPPTSEYSGPNSNGTLTSPIWGSPALVDLTGNGRLDILIGTDEGYRLSNANCPFMLPNASNNCGGSLYGVTAEGELLKSVNQSYQFPRRFYEQIQSTPAVADVNGDGYPEIFVGTGSYYYANSTNKPEIGFRLFGMDRFGNDLDGWENGKEFDGPTPASPAIGDIDGDGDLEIIMVSMKKNNDANSQLIAFHADGQMVNNFPIIPVSQFGDDLPGYNVGSSIVLADYDNDPNHDMEIFLNVGWGVAIIDGNGSYLTTTNYPYDGKPLFLTKGTLLNVPAVGDIDNDGKLELVVTNSEMTVWDLDGSSDQADWPMFKRDAARTSAIPMPPRIFAGPDSLTAFHQAGQNGNAHTSFVIRNTGGSEVDWSLTIPADVSASPNSGTILVGGMIVVDITIPVNSSTQPGPMGNLILTATSDEGVVENGNKTIPLQLILGNISYVYSPVIQK